MPTRNGKIANLPHDLREQLNLRLREGETGRDLAAWLNAQPSVQAVLASQFNSSPISEVNLTHWRQGGYLQWLTERECFDSARELADRDGDLARADLSAERLLKILTLRFGQLLLHWDSTFDESVSASSAFIETARKARILQGISRSVLAIHRIQSQRRGAPTAAEGAIPMAGAETSVPSTTQRRECIPADRTAKNSRDDHADTIAPASLAKSASASSPESPRPSSSNRPPKPPAGLASAPLHLFTGGSLGALPKILSGPIAPSSLHSDASDTAVALRPDSAGLLSAV